MAINPALKKLVKRTIRIIVITALVIIVLVITIVLLIQTPPVQNFARKKIVAYLEGKLHTRVEIGNLYISLPEKIILKNIYLEDQQHDTLLAAGKIEVDISMLKLLSHEVRMNRIDLDGITVKVKRQLPDSSFNFAFVPDAFSGKPAKEPEATDTASAMKFVIGRIHLHNISAVYKDDAGGNDDSVYLGDFETHIRTFDPSHLIFDVPDISLSDTRGYIRQYKPLLLLNKTNDSATAGSAPAQPVSLKLGTIDFRNIALDYRDDIAARNMRIMLGSFLAESESTDLQKMDIRLKQLELKHSFAMIRFDKTISAKNKPVRDTSAAGPRWKIFLTALNLDDNTFQFDDNNKRPTTTGIDYNHLAATHIAIHAGRVLASSGGYSGHIDQLAFTEKKGFTLKKLTGDFLYDDQHANLQNLVIQTDRSDIRNQTRASFTSQEMLSKRPGDTKVMISFNRSVIAARDLLAFVPSLATSFKGKENVLLRVDGKLGGFVKNLDINSLSLSGFGNTAVRLSGNLKGLPDINHTQYNIALEQLVSSRRDIQQLLPAGTIPSSIQIPETFSAKGFFHGGIKQFNAALHAVSSSGDADVSGKLDLSHQSYDVKLNTRSLNIGYILGQQENLGRVSMQADARGSGFDYHTLTSVIHARLNEAEIKKHVYNGLVLDASLQHGAGTIHSSIDNTDIRYKLDAQVNMTQKYPAVKLQLQLDTLNAYALNLLKDSLHLKLTMDADFASTDPDALQGNMKLYNILVVDSARRLGTDTIALIANREDSAEHIRLRSEMVDVDWDGTYKLTETGQAIEQVINTYYAIPHLQEEKITAQDWTLRALFRPSPVVLAYMPSLRGTDSVSALLQFHSAGKNLQMSLLAPKIQFNDEVIHQLQAGINTRDTALDYRISIADAGKPGFRLYASSINGYLAHNRLSASVNLKDDHSKDRYHLSGLLSETSAGWKFAFNPDSLLLNYDKWQIAKNNFIQYDSSSLEVHDLSLNHGGESLSVNSNPPSPNAPLDIRFDRFRIRTLTEFAEQDSLLADGLLNGTVEVKNVLSNPVFTSDLNIQDLSIRKDTVGDVTVKVNNEQANVFAAAITVKGSKTDIEAKGEYRTGESKMDIQLGIGRFDLALLKPFTASQLKDIRGDLKGRLEATGNLDKPVLNGALHFDSAYITPIISGETFRLSSDNIQFDQDGFNFDQFVMEDSAGNRATLDGNVYTKDFKKYRFDLSLNAHNFRLVNAVKEPNRLFYGKLNLDAGVQIAGDLGSPKVNANLRVNKQTNLTLILPSSNPEVVDREGVVLFVDKEHPVDTAQLRKRLDSLSRTSELKGMDVSATIETDSSAQFTMIIDERNGDALTLRGRAYLSGGIDKSGKTTLTGSYELESGAYNVSLSVLKRKFDIQQGSTITWTGDPRTANIDITATYIANVPSIDLVQQQLAGRTQDEINRFKQKLPFRVNMHMTGELLKPVIQFDITLPEDVLSLWPEVDNKLQQIRTDESEVNKQVFALLLLNRFVEENPFESASGGTSANMIARQSVSRILSDQLNQLAGSLIKGVDINFDLNSEQDYSTGQAINQTQLDVGLSKNLFSDRIRVNVGSNFQLENTYPGQSTSNIAGDVSVDYRLSKDGRYMLRAYRKDQYETIVEGEVVETGLSFILTLDYNEFKDLFRNRKEEREISSPGKKKKGNDKTGNNK